VLLRHFERSYQARPRPDAGTFRGLAFLEAWAAAAREVNVARIAETGAFRRWEQIARRADRSIREAARGAAGKLGDAASRVVGQAVDDALRAAGEEARRAADEAAASFAQAGPSSREQADAKALEAGREARRGQCLVLREIFGNPFGPAPVLEPFCLAWNDGAVSRIASEIEEEGSFGDMPVLADALEEAGCTDGAVLEHCRQRSPYGRGCWVLAAVLGKS
jgi:hypothetical protein